MYVFMYTCRYLQCLCKYMIVHIFLYEDKYTYIYIYIYLCVRMYIYVRKYGMIYIYTYIFTHI
jgi:hypothetical protein